MLILVRQKLSIFVVSIDATFQSFLYRQSSQSKNTTEGGAMLCMTFWGAAMAAVTCVAVVDQLVEGLTPAALRETR